MIKWNMKRGINKKGLSPIVATSILIVIVIILAVIILLWARGFIKEAVIKEIAGSSKRAEEFCREIGMRGFVNEDAAQTFGFENTGTIPIFAYRINSKLKGSGSSEITRVGNEEGGSVNPGDTVIISNFEPYDKYESVKIIPVLLGQVEGSTQSYDCPEINGIDI